MIDKDELQQRFKELIEDIDRLPIDTAIPKKDPFNKDALIHLKSKPDPKPHQQRFYYYYHRPTGKMILRIGNESYIVTQIDCAVNTWIVEHTQPPLKYLVSGNANRFIILKDTAIIT